MKSEAEHGPTFAQFGGRSVEKGVVLMVSGDVELREQCQELLVGGLVSQSELHFNLHK